MFGKKSLADELHEELKEVYRHLTEERAKNEKLRHEIERLRPLVAPCQLVGCPKRKGAG